MDIEHVNEPVTLLRNESAPGNHWLGVELRRAGRGDPVGTKVLLEVGERACARFVKGGGVIDYPVFKLWLNRAANFFLRVRLPWM